MSEHKIDPKTGLHLIHSEEETVEAFDAKWALAERLSEAETGDRKWSVEIWYGYLSAILDCLPEITMHGVRPGFSGIWELPAPFTQDFWQPLLEARTQSFDGAFELGALSDVNPQVDPDYHRVEERFEMLVSNTRRQAELILSR